MTSTQNLLPAADGLPAAAHALLASGMVSIVGPDSPDIPPSLQKEIAARQHRFTSKGVGVCHLGDDGRVVIVLFNPELDPSVLNHEMIHAGQVWCSAGAMRAAFMTAAADGKRLVDAAVLTLGAFPDDSGLYRDIHWTKSACQVAMRETELNHAEGAFDLGLMIHPRDNTLALAKAIGLTDRQATVAAMHAHFMLEAGFNAWKSDLAREIVAYRFQSEHHQVIDALFDSAAQALYQQVTEDDLPAPAC